MSLRILLSGMVCGDPWQAGASWAVAQYLLGLRRLGHDVWLVEPVDGELDGDYVREVVCAFGLDGRVAFVERGTGDVVFGAEREAILAQPFDVLLNVAGMLQDSGLVDAIPVRVYLDLDPGFTQLWHAVEGIDMRLAGHTHFVTVGQAIGSDACPIPDCAVEWIHTVPPVVLEPWSRNGDVGTDGAYTTVGNWRSYGSIEHAGIRFGQRAHSMRAFLQLPRAVQAPIQVALAIANGDAADRRGLETHGWRLVDPLAAAGTPPRYQEFVKRSKAEIGFAKSGYVNARCGWFSDRSACYLAAGRPVIAQDTGARALPAGSGLLFFSTLDEVVAAIDDVERDYERHASAARVLAEEHLDSDQVLGRLLEQIGLG